MKVIEKEYKSWKPDFPKQFAKQIDSPVNEDFVLIDKEHQTVAVAQITLPTDKQNISKEVEKLLRYAVKWDNIGVSRLSGIISSNRTFGVLAPQKLRTRYGCSFCKLNEEQPQLYYSLQELVSSCFDLFQTVDKDRAKNHNDLVKSKVHSDWLINQTPFTSGVINNLSALPYHKDSGNFSGSWSMMLSLRKNITGGYLHIPEYDLVAGVPHNSVLIFNGQNLWHGVTPFVVSKKNGFRYTIVWYAKDKVSQCGCLAEETKRSAIEASRM